MSPRAHAPILAYPFAVAAGLFGLTIEHLLSGFAATPSGDYGGARVVVLASFALGEFVLGGAFGLLWPGAGWRWGVWLCAVPACAISFDGRGVWYFLGWGGLTMLPACAGAYAAAALYPRLVGAARN